MACRRFADAELLWHGDSELKGVDAVVIPGGFSYGDYLRVRRDRALLAGDGGGQRVRARRRPGARHLQRLPGAVRGGPAARRAAAQRGPALRLPPGGRSRWSTPPRRSRRVCEQGDTLSIPVKHTTGRYYAPDEALGELEAHGQIILRYAEGHNPNGSALDIAAVCNRDKNVMGLMPHPEHAVDPLTGSADGALPVRVARRARGRARRGRVSATATAPRARPHRRRVRPDRARSSAASPTRWSWRCSR